MAEITAAMVKALRQKTGAGMMDCKKALLESQGDSEQAIDALRRSGLSKAGKRAGRATTEGLVRLLPFADAAFYIMLEVDCETDFVSQQRQFADFADRLARAIADSGASDLNERQIAELPMEGETVAASVAALISILGENVRIRRYQRIRPQGNNVGCYVHGSRIAVLVDLEGGDAGLAKDLAMHVAASRPMCLAEDDLDAETLQRERSIYQAQAQESGKPPEIVEKIVAGKLKKYLAEVSLLGQAFVKDADCSVADLLAQHQAKVHAFYRYEVGEGLEKKKEDFVQEVLAQAGRV